MKNFCLGFILGLFFIFSYVSAVNNGSIGSLFEYTNSEGWILLGENIKDDSITGLKIEDGSIMSEDIKDDTIQSEDIKDATIRSEDIKDGSIGRYHFGNTQIDGKKINIDTLEISGNNIRNSAIDGSKIVDGSLKDIDFDLNTVQKRVVGSCNGGIQSVNKNGSVKCVWSYWFVYGYFPCTNANKGKFQFLGSSFNKCE